MDASSVALARTYESGIKEHSAVHVNRRSVYVVGFIRGEPDGQSRYILRLPYSLTRNKIQQLLFEELRGRQFFDIHRRPDGTRRKGIHSYAKVRYFLREAFHKEHHPALSCRI